MSDEELLTVAESVLRDAIEEVRFSRLGKDLQYASLVANKVEGLKAKIQRRSPVKVEIALIGHQIEVEYTYDLPDFRRVI